MSGRWIDEVLALIHDGPPAVGDRIAVVERLEASFRAATFAQVAQLDVRFRSRASSLGLGWRLLTPETIASWPPAFWPLAACASCHVRGVLRAVAIERLALVSDPAILPFLLVRSSDWVLEIGRRALAIAGERLDAAHAGRWIAAWSYLGRRQRGDTARLAGAVQTLLLSPEARPALRRALRSGKSHERAALLPLLAELPDADANELLEVAIHSSDAGLSAPAVRLRISRLQTDTASDEERGRLAEELVDVSRGGARALALSVWLAASPSPSLGRVRSALLDPSADVRELARFEAARRQLPLDVQEIARAATATGTTQARARALGILHEVGERRPEVYFAFTGTEHSPRLRAAAYAILDKLDVYLDDEVLVDLMREPSARMVRTGAQLLRRRGASRAAIARLLALTDDETAGPLARRLAAWVLARVGVPRGTVP